MSPSSSRGLTLVEVLVVMFVLALLAQAAVLAVGEFAAEGQQRSTTQSLAAIEDAVLGQPGLVDANGRPLIRGFVADVGRLPQRIGDDSQPSQPLYLRELWLRGALPAFIITNPQGDPGVKIGCGWRGPYVDLGIGGSALRDGWNRPFELLTRDETLIDEGGPVAIVRSLGADGLATVPPAVPTGYDADVEVVFERTVNPTVGPRWKGDVPVRVRNNGTTSRDFVVRLYGPENGVVGTIHQQSVPGVIASGEDTYTFVDIPIGARVVRAYVVDAAALPNEDDDLSGSDKSRVYHVTVEAGGVPEILIEMP